MCKREFSKGRQICSYFYLNLEFENSNPNKYIHWPTLVVTVFYFSGFLEMSFPDTR